MARGAYQVLMLVAPFLQARSRLHLEQLAWLLPSPRLSRASAIRRQLPFDSAMNSGSSCRL